jgi:hypothetical protein
VMYCRRLFLRKTRPIQLSFQLFYFMYCIPFLLGCVWHFIFHTIEPADLHPSPAPHFKMFKVFLFYFPNCWSFNTIQIRIPNVALP